MLTKLRYSNSQWQENRLDCLCMLSVHRKRLEKYSLLTRCWTNFNNNVGTLNLFLLTAGPQPLNISGWHYIQDSANFCLVSCGTMYQELIYVIFILSSYFVQCSFKIIIFFSNPHKIGCVVSFFWNPIINHTFDNSSM